MDLKMRILIGILILLFVNNIFAGEKFIEYKIDFEAKRKQFQASNSGSEMQKIADDWNKFTTEQLNIFLKENEKNQTVQQIHKKWLVLKNDYWQALDKKYKKALGSSIPVDHVRAQIDFTSAHLESLFSLVD